MRGSKPRDREIDLNEACPCESGKIYKSCCKKKKFTWMRDRRGRIYKTIEMTERLRSIFMEAEEEFEVVFGRKPRKNDPIFIEKYYISSSDVRVKTIDAMVKANISPSLIYAYRKTGRIVSDPDLLTPDELHEYNDSIDEFYEKLENLDLPELEIANPETPQKYMFDQQRRIQILFGYIIEKKISKVAKFKPYHIEEKMNDIIISFSIVNFTRCLRSILLLLEEGISYDAFPLARSLYENYLSIAFVKGHPEQAETLWIGLGEILGTYGYAKDKRGFLIPNQAVHIESGRIIKIPSRGAMARALGADNEALHNMLYGSLSSYVHSDISNLRHSIGEKGLDYINQDVSFDVLLISLLVSMLTLDIILSCFDWPKYLVEDIRVGMRKAVFTILLADNFLNINKIGKMNPIFKKIIQSLAEKDSMIEKIIAASVIEE